MAKIKQDLILIFDSTSQPIPAGMTTVLLPPRRTLTPYSLTQPTTNSPLGPLTNRAGNRAGYFSTNRPFAHYQLTKTEPRCLIGYRYRHHPLTSSPKVNLILAVEDRMQARNKGLKIDLRHLGVMLIASFPIQALSGQTVGRNPEKNNILS